MGETDVKQISFFLKNLMFYDAYGCQKLDKSTFNNCFYSGNGRLKQPTLVNGHVEGAISTWVVFDCELRSIAVLRMTLLLLLLLLLGWIFIS